MRKAILFPFELDEKNWINYAYVMELAKTLQMPVILFTVISPDTQVAYLDEVYLRLLQLHGFYQTQFNNWQTEPKIAVKRIIKKGCFRQQLQLFIENTPMELLVFQGQAEEA